MSRTLLIVALAGLLNQAPSSALFDAPQLLKDLQTLSADDMQGRQVGTAGGEKARQYIVDRFKQLKLAPIGDSYEYPFTFGAQGERRGVNVVARIEGTSRKDRSVVISAHYDHIGVRNGVVNNGADDNASGTAALFAAAQYFMAHRPQHSIILVAFDGEEAGLLGARAFVKTPPVDLASIGVNVNMDMIGRDADDKLFAVGTRLYPFLRPLLERASAASPLKLLFGHEDPNQRGDDWTRDSDHYAFHQVKIPFVYLGVEDEAQHHKSTDDYETMTYAFYVKAVETSIQVAKVFDAELESIMKQAAPREERTQLVTPTATLVGTLLLPSATRPPVVLIIAGSGPTDRDGNSPALPGKNNSLKMLAEALAADGIASVRYDKRGIGESVTTGMKESDLRFDDFVADAAGWITQLRNDARFSTVFVAGHSEGSLIGMVAARAARADGYVSIAGAGRRASDALREQLRPTLSARPEMLQASDKILSELEAGRTVESVPADPLFTALYRSSIQPYLISWFKYAPATEIARLTKPVLIVQGTHDLQIPVADAEALKKAKPDAVLEIVDGMNHVLKAASADPAANMKAYSDPSLPVVPAVPQSIVKFIRSVKPERHPETARASPRTLVMAEVDGVRLAIDYGRLSKRSRVIWGTLVPWDKTFWTPGADEATTLTTSETIRLGDLEVPAGDYTLYTIPGEKQFVLAVNRDIGQYHLTYRANRDLGRVPMTVTMLTTPVEQLTFAVTRRDGGGTLSFAWDDRQYSVPLVVVKK